MQESLMAPRQNEQQHRLFLRNTLPRSTIQLKELPNILSLSNVNNYNNSIFKSLELSYDRDYLFIHGDWEKYERVRDNLSCNAN